MLNIKKYNGSKCIFINLKKKFFLQKVKQWKKYLKNIGKWKPGIYIEKVFKS